ncbi:hypothetical protein RGR602_PB00094 (plasmid) [Rhizobium gallicum bv. gallicum R602sp]|uniref:Uncharacterized protein n=1 Tax=Rhizobium gallicum bv. gallicum R602sp TaxID=1041138 RepID=A0A0B4XAJ1_9HYPH|nr:hypothetical protein RGR602_PB00094 [Rhizobium gallicum bv. gallicum R602sp]
MVAAGIIKLRRPLSRRISHSCPDYLHCGVVVLSTSLTFGQIENRMVDAPLTERARRILDQLA